MTHHRRGLRRLLKDDTLLARIEEDWRTAGLDARRKAILEYAVTLTQNPTSVQRTHLETLRKHGLEDADILGLAECVAYYAYVNRMVDGLGVALEGSDPNEAGPRGVGA